MASSLPDYERIETGAGEVLIARRSRERLARLDGLIFDYDGVLVDVSRSMHLAHGAAAEACFTSLGWTETSGMVRPADVDAFKLAGGFNNDWDAAAAWQLLYLFKSARSGLTDGRALRAAHPSLEEFAAEAGKRGGGPRAAEEIIREMCDPSEWAKVATRLHREELIRLFKEAYAGDLCREVYGFEAGSVRGEGLIHRDRAILNPSLLPGGMRRGIATGRTRGEAFVGLRLMGWAEVFPPRGVVTEGDGFVKPDPRILELAMERLGVRSPVYVGDTPDDLRTARACGGMLSCLVLTGFGGKDLRGRFASEGADAIAENVNAFLTAITEVCHAGTQGTTGADD